MVLALFLLFLGLTLLVSGGDLLVRGAAGLAGALGISPLVIGLTVVAFGTSAPELAVNLVSAWQNQGQLSFGNVFGSNLANIGLVLGLAVAFQPLHIKGVIIVREIPMMILATVAALVMAADPVLRLGPAFLDRSEGALLLLIFSVFLYYTVGDVLRDRRRDPLVQEATAFGPPSGKVGLWLNVALTGGGLVALIGGGRVTVDAAIELARGMGVPEVVIGLTVVGIGTSLPELVTALVAARKKQTELILGNVLGSNIFNTLLILGASSFVRDIPVPRRGTFDILMTLALSMVLLPFAVTHDRHLVRWEGASLLTTYLGYTIWRVVLA